MHKLIYSCFTFEYILYFYTYFPSVESISPLFGSDPLYRPLQLNGINSSAGYALSLNIHENINFKLIYFKTSITEHISTDVQELNKKLLVPIQILLYHVSIIGMTKHIPGFFPRRKKENIMHTIHTQE